MIHFGKVEHHISERDGTRLCDGEPASESDISSENWMELRQARAAVTLCPDCKDQVNPRDVQPELYGMGRHSTAHLYAVPVLAAFDAIRNCSHCRRHTDEDCPAWRKARKSEAILRQEATRIVRGVTVLRHGTGGRTATIYEFADGSVAYFAPDAPDFAGSEELKCEGLAVARGPLDEWKLPGGHSVRQA